MTDIHIIEKFHSTVRLLFSLSTEEVQSAMEVLMRAKQGSRQENDLLEIVQSYRNIDGSAPLWAMIILGKIHSRAAIPSLLEILDSGWDYWMEAATEALEDIAPWHLNDILDVVPEFIEKRWNHDPENARLFAYSAIAALAPDERAKQFLLYAFSQDDTWQDSIAHDLVRFGDRAVLELFKQRIEYYRRLKDRRAELEWRDAYCELDGDPFGRLPQREQHDLRKRPWKERWGEHFEGLGKEEVEDDEIGEKNTAPLSGEGAFDNPELEKIIEQNRKENDRLEQHSISPFNLEVYLGIRARTSIEMTMDNALRLTGLDDQWTVEKIQRLFDASSTPQEAFSLIAGENNRFASRNALEEFFRRFFTLWNATPRTEFGGLTPEEVMKIRQAAPASDPIGRDDPCPCESGKKYKKCHGG